ncbi:hypothetical protein OG698_44310 [Streptomyces sp. NBC_01003]|uniref:hypothetical protein n=1 Tax=Streptomyces sp. NBC_01003 TaxID=2903714 RepID=UPI00386D8872|nr:hypothetical protein OG698_44310 [Streptomyces sp. NBC_01003]
MNHHDARQEEEPAEHLRFWTYLREFEQVTEADEVDLVSEVLTDPDETMARSAVLRYLDSRAADLHSGPAYESWATKMTQATARYPFLTRRLHGWSLFRAVTLRQSWRPDALLDSSDWLQRKTAEASNAAALEILAARGRTKRIRNAARINLKQQSQG